MRTLWQDIRYGFRLLTQNPGFTAVAVLTLALGIGANTAIFSVVNAVLLRPLPYHSPDRLVHFAWRFKEGTAEALSADQFRFWKDNLRTFESVAALDLMNSGFNLVGPGEPGRVTGLRVSADFFRALGVRPALGRDFLGEEDVPGGPAVAVLSEGLWRRSFGGDRGILGRPVSLDGRIHTVVGVLPRGFMFRPAADVWVPLRIGPEEAGGAHNYAVLGRLRPGVSLSRAQADAETVFKAYVRGQPALAVERGVLLHPYREWVIGNVGPNLAILAGAVGFVLLIACANVAGLLLSRGAVRQRELAIRFALGAGRLRILGQLLAENLMLAMMGGLAGTLFAAWGLEALVAAGPQDLPRLEEVSLDVRVLAFAALISLFAGIFFGLAVWARAARMDWCRAVREGAPGLPGGRGRLRLLGSLVVGEVAASLVLLVGASLVIGSFLRLYSVPLGFDPANLLTVQMSLTADRYGTTAQVTEFQRQLQARLEALPGVVSAASVSSLPMEAGVNIPVYAEGRAAERFLVAEYRVISPDYFRAMNIPLVRGRAFGGAEAPTSSRVVIVNQTLARRLWPDRPSMGERVVIGKDLGPDFDDPPREIVGVAADLQEVGLDQPATPTVYVPQSQVPDGLTSMMNRAFSFSWIVRTESAPGLGDAVRRAVRTVDPELPVARILPMEKVVGESVARRRFNALLMGAFSVLALILAVVGLYGVLSYQVAQRTREIGIRMALGAGRGRVLRQIVGQGMRLVGMGMLLGLVSAFWLTRLLSGLLFEIQPRDPGSFAGVSLLLAGTAVLACYLPARRATRVDPAVALRYE